MNKPASNRRIRVAPLLVLLLLFGSVGLALFVFLTASPVSAAIFAAATPTQEDLWAYADVPKPTHTPTSIPTSIPTEYPVVSPSPIVTEPSNALAMEIVTNAPASALVSDGQQNVQPVNSYGGSKYIIVDISEQHMYVYDGDALVYSFVASTGIGNSTRIGNFAVQTKLPNAYASTWDLWMPNWLGIYYSHGLENGIHALPILSNGATLWAGFLGRPVSYGCVVLGTYEASLLYDWADMGTSVEIQW